MVVFASTAELKDLATRTFAAIMRLHKDGMVPNLLAWRVRELYQNEEGPHLFIASKWWPVNAPEGEYVGVIRRYGQLAIIELDDAHENVIMLGHEVTHGAGGTELDAEVVEHLLGRTEEGITILTAQERREFAGKRGAFFHVVRLPDGFYSAHDDSTWMEFVWE
jgi:hypothetical protein